MFPLLRPINRGDLRSTGISRFIAKPLRSYRSPSLASASSEWPPFMSANHTRLLSSWSGMLRQEPLRFSDACLVTSMSLSNSILSETPGGWNGTRLYRTTHIACAHRDRIGTLQNSVFSGLRGRFRAYTLYLVRLANLLKLWKYTCGRLTKPYPRGLLFPHNIEPLPGSNRGLTWYFC